MAVVNQCLPPMNPKYPQLIQTAEQTNKKKKQNFSNLKKRNWRTNLEQTRSQLWMRCWELKQKKQTNSSSKETPWRNKLSKLPNKKAPPMPPKTNTPWSKKRKWRSSKYITSQPLPESPTRKTKTQLYRRI